MDEIFDIGYLKGRVVTGYKALTVSPDQLNQI